MRLHTPIPLGCVASIDVQYSKTMEELALFASYFEVSQWKIKENLM